MQSLTQDFQRWKLDLRAVCGQMEAQRSMSQLFSGKAERHLFGDLEYAHIESNATSISSVRRRHTGGEEYCFLIMNMAGHQHLCCDDQDGFETAPGDLVLVDPGAPFEILPHGYSENLSLHLPRRLLAAHVQGRFVGGKLDKSLASTRMLGALVQQLVRIEPDYVASKAESHALCQSVVQFLLPTLRREPDLDRSDAPGDEIYHLAIRQIDAHLALPALSPDWLASRLRVSRRHLYRAFAAHEHAGVAQCILARRLARGAALLRDPLLAGKSIGALALDVGFHDFAHFSRAFRRRFGDTPSHYRVAPAP